MSVRIFYPSRFRKAARKYVSEREVIEKKIPLFRTNPLDPRLKTHKLTGTLEGYWAFSVTYHLRILFEFIDETSVGFIDIGTHEIYR